MGLLGDIADGIGSVVGVGVGLVAAPIAIALGVGVDVVQRAIDAGCTTIDEVRRFLDLEP